MTKSIYSIPQRDRPGRDAPADRPAAVRAVPVGSAPERLPRRPFLGAGDAISHAGFRRQGAVPWRADGDRLRGHFPGARMFT